MQKLQALDTVQRPGLYPQRFEVGDHVRFNAFQPHFGIAQIIGLHTEGDVLALAKAVVAFLHLSPEHIAVLAADLVVFVPTGGNVDTLGEVLHVGLLIDKGKLHMDGRIKVIEEIAVAFKDLRFVLRLGKLIIDVEKLHRLGVIPVCDPANTVPVHLPVGNALLHRLGRAGPQTCQKASLLRRSCRAFSAFCVLWGQVFSACLFVLRQPSEPPSWKVFCTSFPSCTDAVSARA